jgi:hypothetical protein
MDAAFDARRITSDWPLFLGGQAGGKLPPALAAAIGAFEAADAVAEPSAAINVNAVTADTAAQAVADAVDAAARAEVFHAAKSKVVDALGRRVLGEAVAAVPEAFARITPELDAAVEELAEAIVDLPDPITDAALVAAGPATLAAYQAALAAQRVLNRLDGFVASVPGGYASSAAQLHVLRLLSPTSRAEYGGLLDVAVTRGKRPDLSPLWIYAVKNGIKFELNSPARQREIADEINSIPIVRKPINFAKV